MTPKFVFLDSQVHNCIIIPNQCGIKIPCTTLYALSVTGNPPDSPPASSQILRPSQMLASAFFAKTQSRRLF